MEPSFGNSVAREIQPMRTKRESRRGSILRCLIAVTLVVASAFPSLAFPKQAEATSNITPACNLTWDELKPHLESGLGVPYLFGGASSTGWDCSGYASWAFNTFGGQSYTHYTTSFENELRAKGSFVMEGAGGDLRDNRMEPGDIIFFYSAGVSEPTHMGVVGERIDGIVMIYHAFTNSFSDIYGNSGTMLQGLDANPGSSLAGIWYMSSGHGKGSWSKFTVYRGVSNTGSVALQKTSANSEISDGNISYSLEGAVYGLYASESHARGNVDALAWLTTDASGKAQVDDIKCGTYYIKETKPSPGFALDENIYPVEVLGENIATANVAEPPQRSIVKTWLSKRDAETDRAAAQGDGSLAQAQFEFSFYGGQFSSRTEAESATNSGVVKRTWIMQTDEQGAISLENAAATFAVHDESGKQTATLPYFVSGDALFTENGSACLPLGTVFIREIKAPAGYALDESLERIINISTEGASPNAAQFEAANIAEQPLRGGISVGKIDRETGKHNPLGKARLEGAVFSVTNNSLHSVIVNGNEYQPGQVVTSLKTDENGVAATGSNELPFGTYAVTETEAPEGYLLDADSRLWSKTVHIREAKTYNLSSPSESVSDQVKRGDISFSKVDGKTMERLAGVPFAITSLTTGEKHVTTTDENGFADTSSEWNAHTKKTNANDAALEKSADAKLDSESGLWFSGQVDAATRANDSLGALPYDVYRIEELPCAANVGKEMLVFEITVKRDKTKLNLGTLDNSAAPAIKTALTNGNGDHLASTSNQIKLIDEIEYEGLTPGKTYTAQGELRIVSSDSEGNLLDEGLASSASGEPAKASIKFSPKTTHGTTQVEFLLDASSLAGKRVVAFEKVILDGKEVAEHSDISDMDQTVSFPEIATTLAVAASPEADSVKTHALVDTVEYRGLVPDKTYLLNAELHIRAADGSDAGVAKDARGNEIVTKQAFSPSSADGSTEVSFSFDAPNLAGETLVAFEKLERNDVVLAVHADISDDAQSIGLPSITTSAIATKTGTKSLPATEESGIVDTVSYSNLVPGKEYRLAATLHRAIKNEYGEIRDEGAVEEQSKAIFTEVTFIPSTPSGEVKVPLSVDATRFSGENLVVFEKCYEDARIVAEHADINDSSQTLSVASISTNAYDAKTGTHFCESNDAATVIDNVRYENLVPGTEYQIEGILHVAKTDKNSNATDEGALLAKDGKPVSATATFTPSEPSGEIELAFSFNAKGLEGKSIVAFETLKYDDVALAEHADINDKNQSVAFPEKTPPAIEENPIEKIKQAFAKTGDSPISTIAVLAIAGTAIAIASVALRLNRRSRL